MRCAYELHFYPVGNAFMRSAYTAPYPSPGGRGDREAVGEEWRQNRHRKTPATER